MQPSGCRRRAYRSSVLRPLQLRAEQEGGRREVTAIPGHAEQWRARLIKRALRYLILFDDGGSGMRHRDEPLAVGDELDDGGSRYRVERV